MARPNVNRAAFAGAGSSNLAGFAAPVVAAEAAAPVVAVPAPVEESDDEFLHGATETEAPEDDVDEPASAPAARKRRAKNTKVVAKSFPMTESFVQQLQESRTQWHMQDPSRFAHFGGMASENAFIQAVARLGMERIAANEKDARRLMKLFPENTRTR